MRACLICQSHTPPSRGCLCLCRLGLYTSPHSAAAHAGGPPRTHLGRRLPRLWARPVRLPRLWAGPVRLPRLWAGPIRLARCIPLAPRVAGPPHEEGVVRRRRQPAPAPTRSAAGDGRGARHTRRALQGDATKGRDKGTRPKDVTRGRGAAEGAARGRVAAKQKLPPAHPPVRVAGRDLLGTGRDLLVRTWHTSRDVTH